MAKFICECGSVVVDAYVKYLPPTTNKRTKCVAEQILGRFIWGVNLQLKHFEEKKEAICFSNATRLKKETFFFIIGSHYGNCYKM